MPTPTNTTTAIRHWRDENPLRVWRTTNGLSMMDTAPLVDVGLSTIQVWETGLRSPNDEQFDALAAAMKCSAANLRGRWTRWLKRRPT